MNHSCQVDFEGSKHEIRHLQEEVDLVTQQVEELSNLKKIAEKQLEESLEALQNEREQRYQLKKEMDAKLNSDSMYDLGNLAMSIQGAEDGGGGEGDDSEATAVPSASYEVSKNSCTSSRQSSLDQQKLCESLP